MKTFHLIAAILFISVCAPAQSLQKVQWKLYAIRNLETGAVEKIDTTLSAILEFKSDTTFRAMCGNGYWGKYRSDKKEGTLVPTEFWGTKKNSMGPKGVLEKKYIPRLRLAQRYKISGDTLKLFTSDKNELIFRK